MTLEGKRFAPVENPTEDQVRQLIQGLTNGETSFAYLTDQSGNYVQAAGSRPWCFVERRTISPAAHYRAFQNTPNPKYNDGAKIRTGARNIKLQHDQWFLLKDAAEIFVAFLANEKFPDAVEWRSMNEMLGLL